MKLLEVSNARLARIFHEIPFSLYKDDPHWIPYIRQDIEKLFNPEANRLFAEGGSAIRWILQDDRGKFTGRIAAFINPRTIGTAGLKTGGTGFFECINNQEAANILFDAAKEWLSSKGMEAMDGPINFGDRNQFWGLQISNWDHPPIYPMNYNPPYYRQLFENYGWQTYFEQYVYGRKVNEPAQELFYRKYKNVKDNPDITVRNIRGMKIEQVAENFQKVYNAAWGGHSHFKTLKKETALKIMNAMKPAIDPEIIIFAYYKNEPVGFYVNLPELNQVFKHVNGNMNWLGKLKFLYHIKRKTADWLTGIIFGVVKEWQGKGIEAAMIVYGENSFALKGRYQYTVLSWIGDFNPRMIKVAENLGAVRWRNLITYRYQFNREIPFERAPIVG